MGTRGDILLVYGWLSDCNKHQKTWKISKFQIEDIYFHVVGHLGRQPLPQITQMVAMTPASTYRQATKPNITNYGSTINFNKLFAKNNKNYAVCDFL